MKASEEEVAGYHTTLVKILRDKERWDKERKEMIQDIRDEIRAEIDDDINKQHDDMKQEMLYKLKVEISNIIKQRTTDVEKRIIEDYLKPCLGGLEKDVNEMKNDMVTRNEMNERFDEFLNDFSHAIESIEDPKVKGILQRTVGAFRSG